MIKILLELLQQDDFLDGGEAIQIAKGKYELPTTLKGATKKIKRQWQLKR
jgi:hypothetical protein